MIIKKATLEDSAVVVACLLLAMEDIVYEFIGVDNHQKANEFLLYFVTKEENQYSYQNCWVAEVDGKVVAAVNLYDGAKLSELREPVARYIKMEFGKDFNPEDETQAGEYYIDSLGVDASQQGKGIGTKLLQFLIGEFVVRKHQVLGLLVDEKKPDAKRLYLKLGFKTVEKKTLVGKHMEHLQIDSSCM